jgi:16S rRNA (guanine527-N7)-methyltransferase
MPVSMSPAEADELRAAVGAFGVQLDDAGCARIACFLDLLATWNTRFHLTGDRDRTALLRKHVVDSLAPARWLPATGAVVDVGSGAGFPGVVLACVQPTLEFHLVEARRRPCSFLAEVARVVPLRNVHVVAARAEDAADGALGAKADVVLSRAVRLDAFVAAAIPFLAVHGAIVAMRAHGGAAEEERVAAAHGLAIRDVFEYRLPDGEARRLVRLEKVSPGSGGRP